MKKFIQGRCLICYQTLVFSHHGICSFCLAFIPKLPPCCCYCALPTANSNHCCYQCMEKRPPWRRLIAVSGYEEPLKWLIHRMKFNGQSELSYALSRLLLLQWQSARRHHGFLKPDIVLPVPLFRNQQWRRGFNQAALLAKPLAYWLNVPYTDRLLLRKRTQCEQKKLLATHRRDNLKQAFYCKGNVSGKRVLLVDDIVTTGSTIYEICDTLQQHDPSEIQVICLCRTL